MKEQLDQGKEQLPQASIFNANSSLNQICDTKNYYQNETKLNGVYSGNTLPKMMYGEYVMNLGEFKSK